MLACNRFKWISIHSLRTEGDCANIICKETADDFNPLPPDGGRLQEIETGKIIERISIHSLRTEGDRFAVSFFY